MKKILLILLLSASTFLVGCADNKELPEIPEIEEEITPVYPEVDYDKPYVTYQYSNPTNSSLADYEFNDSNIYKTYNWTRTYFASGVTQNTIFVYEHLIMLPEEKTYELFIRGLGDTRVYIGDDFDNLELKVEQNFTTLSQYDYYNFDTIIEVDNKVGKPIAIRVEIQTSTRAEFYIGYIDTVGKISNIPDSCVAMFKETE